MAPSPDDPNSESTAMTRFREQGLLNGWIGLRESPAAAYRAFRAGDGGAGVFNRQRSSQWLSASGQIGPTEVRHRLGVQGQGPSRGATTMGNNTRHVRLLTYRVGVVRWRLPRVCRRSLFPRLDVEDCIHQLIARPRLSWLTPLVECIELVHATSRTGRDHHRCTNKQFHSHIGMATTT